MLRDIGRWRLLKRLIDGKLLLLLLQLMMLKLFLFLLMHLPSHLLIQLPLLLASVGDGLGLVVDGIVGAADSGVARGGDFANDTPKVDHVLKLFQGFFGNVSLAY